MNKESNPDALYEAGHYVGIYDMQQLIIGRKSPETAVESADVEGDQASRGVGQSELSPGGDIDGVNTAVAEVKADQKRKKI